MVAIAKNAMAKVGKVPFGEGLDFGGSSYSLTLTAAASTCQAFGQEPLNPRPRQPVFWDGQ